MYIHDRILKIQGMCNVRVTVYLLINDIVCMIQYLRIQFSPMRGFYNVIQGQGNVIYQ